MALLLIGVGLGSVLIYGLSVRTFMQEALNRTMLDYSRRQLAMTEQEKVATNRADQYRMPSLNDRRAEAKIRYASGEEPQLGFSATGIAIYGYGTQDKCNFWEYPLAYADLSDEHKAEVNRFSALSIDVQWHMGSKITSK